MQAHLDSLKRRAPCRYGREVRAVNTMLAALRWGVMRSFANRCFICAIEEALQRLGGPLDFAEQRCRVILGTQIARHATLLMGRVPDLAIRGVRNLHRPEWTG